MPVVIETGVTDTKKATVLWNNVWENGVISTSGAAVGYPAINVIDPSTSKAWKPNVSGGVITVDCGAAVTVNFIGIAAHTLATNASFIQVVSSDDNITWVSRSIVNPLTDDDLIILIPTVSARYWGIVVSGQPIIGVVFMGARLIFPHAPIDSYTPLNHSRKYTKFFNSSIGGHLISNRVQSISASTMVDLGFVQRSFVDGPLPAFKSHYDQGGTFFYAGCPSLYPLDMGYCVAGSEDETVAVEYIQADKLANLSFGVMSYVGS